MVSKQRLIDANAAIERAKESDKIVGSSIWETCEVVEFLEDCPIVDAVEVGSDPTAAGGGNREGSEWQRSAGGEPALSGEGSAGYRNRMHGRWEQIGYDKAMDRISCSCCKEYWNIADNDTDTFNYCPNCGAKMDGDGNG